MKQGMLGFSLLCATALIGCSKDGETKTAAATAKLQELSVAEVQSLEAVCNAADVDNPEGFSYGDRAATLQRSLDACLRLWNEYPGAKYDAVLNARESVLRERFDQYDRIAEVERLTKIKQFDQARKKLEVQRNQIGEEIYGFVSRQIRDAESAQATAYLDQKFPGLSTHAKELHVKYANRLTFKTAEAQRIVESFNIDCRAPDHRYLPLSNVIYAKLAELDSEHAHLESVADSRDGEVRIIDQLISSDGTVMNEVVAYEIDKWGELYSRAAHPDALRNACFRGWGEIWVVP